jgi:two-component system response regulator BaeR
MIYPSASPTQSTTRRRILLVEDDAKIADMVSNYLLMHDFDTDLCTNGLDAAGWVRTHPVDLVLLDVMLPGLDGMAVCAALREFSTVPIIMVTARVDEMDRLNGLDTGAEDYLCKPFSPRELVGRMRALLRRTQGTLTRPAVASGLQVNEARQQLQWHGQPLALTQVEFRLMGLLLSRPGHVFSRAHLLDSVHEDFRDVSDRAIDSHIKNLRRKLEQAGTIDCIITSVYGVGYRLDVSPPAPRA